MYKAEQLNLFEIEPEDSEAIYGADIPFLVVETTLTPTLTMTANVTAETHGLVRPK